MFHLAWPWVSIALILPWLLRGFLPAVPPSSRLSIRVPFADQHTEISSFRSVRPASNWLLIALVAAWGALVLAAARPQWIGEPVSIPITGRDLMLVLDVSASMGEQDEFADGQRMDRYSSVKSVALEFIENRRGDRFGLILFGSKPYLQVPLTFDRAMASTFLREAMIGLAGSGTAIGDALGLALHTLRGRPAKSRVAILLTDGENNAGQLDPVTVAMYCAEHDLKVHTIGLGNDAELDRGTLREIARLTGGRYFDARDPQTLARVYAQIDVLEPATERNEVLRSAKELFHWPLTCALLLGLVIVIARHWPTIRQSPVPDGAEH